MATITRKVPDLLKLPRIGLNNLKDLPGARKAVSYYSIHLKSSVADKTIGTQKRPWTRLKAWQD